MRLKFISSGRGGAPSAKSVRGGRRVGGLGWLLALVLACGCFSARAQWLTESITIKPGWTAVYLNVDASGYGENIDQLVGNDPSNPIAEIWLWRAAITPEQYVTTPLAPISAGSHWITWIRNASSTPNALELLIPNSAYLIHSTATTNYTWKIKGQPVPPSYLWDITGLNLIGFSTPSVNPPSFQNFLAPATPLANILELYNLNPGPVFSQYLTKVTRGQAFWVRATNVNNTYFGPFTVSLPNPEGIAYGDSSGQITLHLQNATVNPLTVYARMLPSEAPPYGQTNIVSAPPLLLEGALNSTNLTYGYTELTTNNTTASTNVLSWTLAPVGQPGSDVAVVLGINRYAMMASPGSLYAGTLQFTDSLGFSEVDVPVSAVSASTAGLWVGAAAINQVGSYLKSYATYATTNETTGAVSTNMMTDPVTGKYVVTNVNTALGSVVSPYPLRLILFNDGATNYLLERVYFGLRENTNLVVATTESVLDTAHLDTARRITATHLPWSQSNVPWSYVGPFGLGNTVQFNVSTDYGDQTSSPFLHTYHPDHSNLDSTGRELEPGVQSYTINRQIILQVAAPGADFVSLTTANASLAGSYREVITMLGLNNGVQTFNTAGNFSLTRISTIGTLTTR